MDLSIRYPALAILPFLALGPGTGQAAAQDYRAGGNAAYQEISARVWFDRGDEPVVDRGDRMRIYYGTSEDAYVAIFNIDTNGTVRLVHPRSPEENNWVRGGRDYRLLFPRSPYWYVDDHPGMGYYFIVASPEPFDFSSFDFSYYDGGWDLTRVGRTVYRDPYVAMDDYVAALVPDWEYTGYGLDFATYHVGEDRYDYPRFVCYDCHGFRAYTTWNPYHYHCTSFRMVVYDDPWYYPSYRYRGTRVVYADIPYANIPRVRLPRYEFKERADHEAGTPIIATRATSGPRAGVAGDDAQRRGISGIGSGGDAPTARPGDGDASPRRPGIPDDVGTPRRGGGITVAPSSGASGTDRGDGTRIFVPRRGGSDDRGGARPEERRPTSPVTPGWTPVLPPRGEPTGPDASRPSERGRPQEPTRPVGPTRENERTRPVLERRPTTTRPTTRGGGDATGGERERPSDVVGPPRGRTGVGTSGTGGTPTRPSIPTTTRTRPTAGSGGTASPGRPPVVKRPSGGATGPTRPPPTARRPGGSSSSDATPRSSRPARPPVIRRGGGSGSGSVGRTRSGGSPPSRPPVRVKPRSGGSSGSSGGGAAPPARVPTRRGGGDGG